MAIRYMHVMSEIIHASHFGITIHTLLAEGVRFELTEGINLLRFSRPVQ